MSKDRKTRALEVCLQRIAVGDEIEQSLRAYPRWAHELRPLLHAAKSAQAFAHTIQVPEDAQRNSQQTFLETAAQMIPKTSPAGRRRKLRQALLLIIAIVALVLVASQAVNLSPQALPGDFLYPLKLRLEAFELSMTGDLDERLSLEIENDRERVREAQRLLDRGSIQPVSFSAGLQESSNGEWLVGDLRVLIQGDTRMVGEILPGYVVTVEGETDPNGVIFARRVQMREYYLTGEFQEISPSQWSVDGVLVLRTPQTVQHDIPQAGSQVNIIALLSMDELFHARLLEAAQPNLE